MHKPQSIYAPNWTVIIMLLSGLYNLVWGGLVVVFPAYMAAKLGWQMPHPVEVWQCLGMVVGVYGVAYLLAAADTRRHWPIVLAGLLGKVLGPLGLAMSVASGSISRTDGWLAFLGTLLSNDVIWWIPFAAVLYDAWRHAQVSQTALRDAFPEEQTAAEAAKLAKNQHGRSLYDESQAAPILTTFLRHSGCLFCREALSDLAEKRQSLEATGVRLGLVHMSSDAAALKLFAAYGLQDVDRYSDPAQKLYHAFQLPRGSLWHLFGPTVMRRGFEVFRTGKHGQGAVDGDGLQLGGVFLFRRGRVVRALRLRDAGERPPYDAMACEIPQSEAVHAG